MQSKRGMTQHTGEDSMNKSHGGFKKMELGIIIAVLLLIIVAGAIFINVTSKSAYDITLRHDLQAFGDYQKFYYKINNRCIGEPGQSVRNDGIESDINLEGYTLSEGICITIVSGTPDNPNDPDNPFTFQAKHEKSDTVLEYSFRSGKITER